MNKNNPDSGGCDAVLTWRGANGPLSVRLYRGTTAKRSEALLVFFPPGGFVSDDPAAADGCMATMARACHINVVAPGYALAPEHPFPAAAEDAHAVLLQAMRQRASVNWAGTHLFVGGVEAGGNLAAVSALIARDRQGPPLAGQILVMPMLDPTLASDSMRQAITRPGADAVAQAAELSYRTYLPRPMDRTHPYACPLNSTRLAGLPPALVVYADGDPLCDEARAYANKLENAGVPVERVALQPGVMRDAHERCQATADDPAMKALAAFLRPFTDPSPSSSKPTRSAT